MDMTEAFRGEDIAKTDFFDFVVSPDADAQHAALTFKSMGIFIDGGGSQGHVASTPPPPAAPPAFSDHHQQQQGGGFWASTSSCDNKDLDDLAPYCWGAEDGGGGGKGNTDGAIYTLTVLNGGADHAAATWYRPPEAVKDLDLDSLLSIIPAATAAAPPPTAPPPAATAPFPSYDDAFNNNNNNNNDWKLGDGNDSLLRSALEGKAPPLRRALSTPDHNSSSGASSVDDLLLSQLDAASYPEDYEKLKRIATEVAQYCGGGVGTFLGAETPPPPQAAPQQQQARAKKYAKKQQQTNQQQPAGSARKERSLHYCSICSKGFKDKYSVNVHIRTHTGEKPFACSLCGKSFRQKAHLAKHYQTHVAHKAVPSNGAKQRFTKTS